MQTRLFKHDMTEEEFNALAGTLELHDISGESHKISCSITQMQQLYLYADFANSNPVLHKHLQEQINKEQEIHERLQQYTTNKLHQNAEISRRQRAEAYTALMQRLTQLNVQENKTPAQQLLIDSGFALASSYEPGQQKGLTADVCIAAKKILDNNTPANRDAFAAVIERNHSGEKRNYPAMVGSLALAFLGAAVIACGAFMAASLFLLPIGLAFVGLGVCLTATACVMVHKSLKRTGDEYALHHFHDAASARKVGLFSKPAAQQEGSEADVRRDPVIEL